MTTKRLGLVGGLLVGCLAMVLAYSRWTNDQRAQATAVRAELARLRAQVGSLASAQDSAARVGLLMDAAAELRSAAASSAAKPKAGERTDEHGNAAPPVLTPEQLIERQRRFNTERVAAIAAQLDERLRTSGHDRSWGDTIESGATNIIETSESGRVQKVDCAADLCRIYVVHDFAEQQTQLAARISGHTPFNEGDVLYQYDESGLTTTLYKTKIGTPLVSMLADGAEM